MPRCNCEDYPCCGHGDIPYGDNDPYSPYADMTNEEIKQAVYDRMSNDDYDPYYDD